MKKPYNKIQKKLPLKIETEKIHHLAYSLEYLTTNKNFTFDYFKNNIRDKATAYNEFFRFLCDISNETRLSISNKRKDEYLGYEEISYGSLKFSTKSNVLSNGDNVFIFRFFRNNYRAIGFFKSGISIFYIIGFDFDFSAYNH